MSQTFRSSLRAAPTSRRWSAVFCGASLLCATHAIAVLRAEPPVADAPAPTIRYQRDIRPLLTDRCLPCHGPDAGTRKAELRLDDRASATSTRAGDRAPAIVPGDPARSPLVARVRSHDPEVQMPPPESRRTLTARDVELLETWIAEGASYEQHWSFAPLSASASNGDPMSPNPIDAFIRSNGPLAPRADAAALARRVTYDLTGMPPSPAEVDALDAERLGESFAALVDRLLASPRYGEHMARFWLDAARYGDTHGLHLDNERVMWKYRDWVIEAFNRNLPFDQFTIEQLAGDLLPSPTLDQLIASGFNRCNVTTSEGGAIDAEYLVKYAVDRVETTSAIWLGLTLGCAQCHDHKFDPFSQEEFYSLFAFFNSTAEAAMDGNAKAPTPIIRVPEPAQIAELAALSQASAPLVAELDASDPDLDAQAATWIVEREHAARSAWQILSPHSVTGAMRGDAGPAATFATLDDGSVLVAGHNPPRDTYTFRARLARSGLLAVRLEALLDASLAKRGPGRAHNGNFVLSEVEVDVTDAAGAPQRVRLIDARADHEQLEFPVLAAIDGKFNDPRGWAVLGADHPNARTALFVAANSFGADGAELTLRLHFNSSNAQHGIGRFRVSVSADPAATPARLGPWHVLGPLEGAGRDGAFARDYGPEAKPRPLDTELVAPLAWTERNDLVDAISQRLFDLPTSATYLARRIDAATPRTLRAHVGSDDALKVFLNGALVHQNLVDRGLEQSPDVVVLNLPAGENWLLLKIVNNAGQSGFSFRIFDEEFDGDPLRVLSLISQRSESLSDTERGTLAAHFRRRHWPRGRELSRQIEALDQRRRTIEEASPTTLVSQELAERRPAHLLERGQYHRPLRVVTPDVPAALPPLESLNSPPTRLDLARWLVAPNHPLTARVSVNRIWQQLFGRGLVKTAEDFGAQGEPPSHPELLDFLARRFIESGWDVKALVRSIVTSATYQQSSRVTPAAWAADPENRLLLRGARRRLDAEMIRDGALAMSGLLVEKLGGPGVKPYQPSGLWEAVGYVDSNTANFVQDHGEQLYRRSIYTFWKRTSPPPALTLFDAPSREYCLVRRERTNTPLAALLLMNDTQYVEAARHFAERLRREVGDDPAQRIAHACRIALARRPTAAEHAELTSFVDSQLAFFRAKPLAATRLLTVGESARAAEFDASEHAAWTMLASLLLNLDETISQN
ncbi:MAG: PSD1 and planctomycete cytochrome C domain-containing protein [Planctomycetota bacterium]